MKNNTSIHQILLRAVCEIKDVLIEKKKLSEIAEIIDRHASIPEPAKHDENEQEKIIEWS